MIPVKLRAIICLTFHMRTEKEGLVTIARQVFEDNARILVLPIRYKNIPSVLVTHMIGSYSNEKSRFVG